MTDARWAELVAATHANPWVARALYDLAAEFWRHSSRLERALERV